MGRHRERARISLDYLGMGMTRCGSWPGSMSARMTTMYSWPFCCCRHAALKRGLIRLFEPFKHLRWGDRPFRQMRVEGARADI